MIEHILQSEFFLPWEKTNGALTVQLPLLRVVSLPVFFFTALGKINT